MRILPILLLFAATGALADEPLRVAVTPFTNGSPDASLDPLGKGLQSMLTTDLSYLPDVEVVERERLSELLHEVELGEQGWLEPSTAVAAGHLAGATHLVAGSFTLVGDHLRLDARLFAVDSATVVVAESVEGERELFFDLEKDLVGSVASELVGELPPRVRVKVQRVHTADFDAFTAFSAGLEAYDAADYEQALADLRRATVLDEDFGLAAMTLADYAELAERSRSRAEALADVERERQRLERARAEEDALAAATSAVSVLLEVATTADAGAEDERLTALWLLWRAYLGADRTYPLHELQDREDGFALARLGDKLACQYLAEAADAWPRVPATLDTDLQLTWPGDDREALRAQARVLTGADDPDAHRAALRQGLHQADKTARALHLDRAGEVALLAEYERLGRARPLDDASRHAQLKLAEAHMRVLQLDEAAQLAGRLSASADESGTARDAARLAEDVHALASALAAASDPRARELALIALNRSRSLSWILRTVGELGTELRATEALLEMRQWHNTQVFLLGGTPTWLLQGHRTTYTGPRTDPRRADRLVWSTSKEDPVPALLMVGDAPLADHTARLSLRWEPSDGHPGPDHAGDPEVAWLLGVSDVQVPSVQRVVPRPMVGWRAVVADGELRVERFTARREDRVNTALEGEVLGRAALDGLPDELVVKVKGARVTARAGGATVRVDLPEPPEGYRALWVDGPGHVEVELN